MMNSYTKERVINGTILIFIQKVILTTENSFELIKCVDILRIIFCHYKTSALMPVGTFSILRGLLTRTNMPIVHEDSLYIMYYCADSNPKLMESLVTRDCLQKIFDFAMYKL